MCVWLVVLFFLCFLVVVSFFVVCVPVGVRCARGGELLESG